MELTEIEGSINRVNTFFGMWGKLNNGRTYVECKKEGIQYYNFHSEEIQYLWSQLKEKDKKRITKMYKINEDKYINESDMKYACHLMLDDMWKNGREREMLYHKLSEVTKIRNCHFHCMNIYQTHIAYRKLLQLKRDYDCNQLIA